MQFTINILGNTSAIPTVNRNGTSQLININENYCLIDCSEGTQIQLRRYHFKFQRINHIFISHLHGDHFFGLIGLLFTMHLLGRETPITIYGFEKLQKILQVQIHTSDSCLRFPINFVPIQENTVQKLLDTKFFEVTSFPLKHKIPCAGFLFKEKPRPANIIKDKIAQYKIPFLEIPAIKSGNDYKMPNGKVILNSELVLPAPLPRSYAFCTDTQYIENLNAYFSDVDLLYHESTFTKDFVQRAKETGHSTTHQAAKAAVLTNAKNLLLGHFSIRYTDLEVLSKEASEIFNGAISSKQGHCYQIQQNHKLIEKPIVD